MGSGGHEADGIDPRGVGKSLDFVPLLKRQVWDDDSIDAALDAEAEKPLGAEAEDGVHVHHEQKRHVGFLAQLADHLEDFFKGRAVLQRAQARLLDHRPLGNRVGEGHAQLHHVGTALFHSQHQVYRSVQVRVSRRHKGDEGFSALLFELFKFPVDSIHGFVPPCTALPDKRPCLPVPTD